MNSYLKNSIGFGGFLRIKPAESRRMGWRKNVPGVPLETVLVKLLFTSWFQFLLLCRGDLTALSMQYLESYYLMNGTPSAVPGVILYSSWWTELPQRYLESYYSWWTKLTIPGAMVWWYRANWTPSAVLGAMVPGELNSLCCTWSHGTGWTELSLLYLEPRYQVNWTLSAVPGVTVPGELNSLGCTWSHGTRWTELPRLYPQQTVPSCRSTYATLNSNG